MMNGANWTNRLHELARQAGVPGATLGIWSDGQQVLAAHGVLNHATGVLVTDDSLFQVGSITKIWTTTMIMQLVDEGRLSLRDHRRRRAARRPAGRRRRRRPGYGPAPAHAHQRDRR